jgi:glycine hydroxymethyltransferase
MLVDLRNTGVDGARVERILELVNIASNKNTIPSDVSALVPNGVRVGTPAMTTRGCGPAEFIEIVRFIDEAIKIAKRANETVQSTKFKDFAAAVGDGKSLKGVSELKQRVCEFAVKYPVVF